jgi:hypothetical protein
MIMNKPFSPSCENNKQPILQIIRQQFAESATVWEIGSGTGQHACYFAQQLPHLVWQATDKEENLAGINAWVEETALDNLVEFSDADGGIFCLYNNQLVKDYWEYINMKGISNDDKNFNDIMDTILKTYDENKLQNFKQPHFAPEYNHVISYPLSVRNDKKGVIQTSSSGRATDIFIPSIY